MIENRLKPLMVERMLSIEDLMRLTGLSRNTISNLINKRRSNINMDTFEKLLDALEVTPNQFFKVKDGYESFEKSTNDDHSKLEQIKQILDK